MDFTQNYFELLSVPQAYFIDKSLLSTHYRDLQKTFHPDKSANKPASDQRIAVQFAGYINTAYHTLLSPVARAEYLLSLEGEIVDNQSTTISDGQFLFLQMEWRETLADIAALGDRDNAESQLECLYNTVKSTFTELEQQFNRYYLEKNWSLSSAVIAKLHFVEKMLKEIDTIEASLFD